MDRERKIGKIMANYAYLGTAIGLLATYGYLKLYKEDKKKLFIGGVLTLGGLALGSYLGANEVKRQKL